MKYVIIFCLFVSGSLWAREKNQEEWVTKKNYEFSTNWFGPDKQKSWREALKEYAGKKNVKYLEVGVYEGRSLLWTLDHILTDSSTKVTAVDRFSPPIYKTFASNLDKSGHKSKVTIISDRSETALPRLPKEAFDIIYIDGAHDMKTVTLDAINAWNLLKPGGVLIFDDYLMGEDRFPVNLRPQKSIDAFLVSYKQDLNVLHMDMQVLVRKNPVLKPWCHFCTWFGPYTYEWYEGELKLDSKKLKITESNKVKLENLLRKYSENLDYKKDDELEQKAVQFAKSYAR